MTKNNACKIGDRMRIDRQLCEKHSPTEQQIIIVAVRALNIYSVNIVITLILIFQLSGVFSEFFKTALNIIAASFKIRFLI